MNRLLVPVFSQFMQFSRLVSVVHQGIYDGMTLDEIKKMDPEEHKVIEEHPFNYRYLRGEVIQQKIQLSYTCRAEVSKHILVEVSLILFIFRSVLALDKIVEVTAF